MAAAIRADPDHRRSAAFLQTTTEPLVVPQLVLAEAAYFVAKQLGTTAESAFLRELADASLELHPLEDRDLARMAELIETYADLRLGTVDASVIATPSASAQRRSQPSTCATSPSSGRDTSMPSNSSRSRQLPCRR